MQISKLFFVHWNNTSQLTTNTAINVTAIGYAFYIFKNHRYILLKTVQYSHK